MIPAMNIVAWSKNAPWAEQRQIEQDLIISRALVELFNDPFLVEQLRFRGGTALNKLRFAIPRIAVAHPSGTPIKRLRMRRMSAHRDRYKTFQMQRRAALRARF